MTFTTISILWFLCYIATLAYSWDSIKESYNHRGDDGFIPSRFFNIEAYLIIIWLFMIVCWPVAVVFETKDRLQKLINKKRKK